MKQPEAAAGGLDKENRCDIILSIIHEGRFLLYRAAVLYVRKPD
jgi:hypothetical protein